MNPNRSSTGCFASSALEDARGGPNSRGRPTSYGARDRLAERANSRAPRESLKRRERFVSYECSALPQTGQSDYQGVPADTLRGSILVSMSPAHLPARLGISMHRRTPHATRTKRSPTALFLIAATASLCLTVALSATAGELSPHVARGPLPRTASGLLTERRTHATRSRPAAPSTTRCVCRISSRGDTLPIRSVTKLESAPRPLRPPSGGRPVKGLSSTAMAEGAALDR